jgi:predicted esterase
LSSSYNFDLLAARVHGRVYRRPASGHRAELLLVGFHGYGESAEDLMAEMDLIPGSSHWTLACVQGLHRFYNRRTGDVVASWMTRQDRLQAIEDNQRYVATAVESLKSAEDPGIPIAFVGFSQGTAMAYRAAGGVKSSCQGVIAVGGDVPPELAEADLTDFPPVLIGWGSEDQWYGETKLKQDLELLSGQRVLCESVQFSGGHEWTDEFRGEASRWLQKIAASRPEAP